jgi:hypothetical protein
MGYYDNNNVAGAGRSRRKYDDVAGASRRHRRNDDVAGAFDDNFKVKVKAFIEGEEFCRAVRRCLINDLVAAAEDDDDRKDCCKRR